jgi:hypothetical protein
MSLSKTVMLAAGLALGLSTMGLATKSHAQGAQNTPANMQSDMGEDEVIYLNAETGKMTKASKKMTAAHHTKAMAAGAKPLAAGTVIYKKGGKLYLLENKKTGGGKGTAADTFQDVFDGGHQY